MSISDDWGYDYIMCMPDVINGIIMFIRVSEIFGNENILSSNRVYL